VRSTYTTLHAAYSIIRSRTARPESAEALSSSSIRLDLAPPGYGTLRRGKPMPAILIAAPPPCGTAMALERRAVQTSPSSQADDDGGDEALFIEAGCHCLVGGEGSHNASRGMKWSGQHAGMSMFRECKEGRVGSIRRGSRTRNGSCVAGTFPSMKQCSGGGCRFERRCFWEPSLTEPEKRIRGGRRTAHQLLVVALVTWDSRIAAVGAVRAKAQARGGGALQTMEAEGKERNRHNGFL
jgi:hypothetical protein